MYRSQSTFTKSLLAWPQEVCVLYELFLPTNATDLKTALTVNDDVNNVATGSQYSA